MKIILKSIFFLLFAIVVLVVVWTIWENNRNPITLLDVNPGQITTVTDTPLVSRYLSENREYRHLELSTENIDDIEAYISLPLVRYIEKIPVIIVLGGLEIGIHNFRYISEPGNNAIIIFQYPYQPDQWINNSAIRQIPIVRKSILDVPAQVLCLIDWINRQSWADTDRITLTGYSFGALFVPAIYHLDNVKSQKLGPGVIAYGGTDIYLLLMTNMKKTRLPFRMMESWFAATTLHPIEPEIHLEHMNNEFLVINGTLDDQIPEESWKKLHDLIPEPKTIFILEEGHMHPNNTALTMKLVNLSKQWLRKHNVINP